MSRKKNPIERKAIRDRHAFFGNTPPAINILKDVQRIATKNTPILLEGETGTGKSLLARMIHESSQRKGHFVSINCSTFSPNLLETELFGHSQGAFTGARDARKGLIASAQKGTLFLDEIGELPLDFQPKILHLLEEKMIRPVGSDTEFEASVRIIAATNLNLKERVKQGLFRADLYYRINVIPFIVPPLRERLGDIQELTSNFIEELCEEHDVPKPDIPMDALTALSKYDWPGNIRELRNHIERALLLGLELHERLPQDRHLEASHTEQKLKSHEKMHILKTISDSLGNKSKAAIQLGISRRTLDRKLKRWKEDAA